MRRKLTGFYVAGILALGVVGGLRAQQPAGDPGTPSPQPSDTRPPARVLATANPDRSGQIKNGKQPYAGPTTVVELPPTPMLDEEGKQRLDPEGKPMFNPPVRQQRDKKGHPVFDAEGGPVMQTPTAMGYDENGKRIHEKKEKPPKTTSISIARGTLTVDGMIGKAAMNYEIADLKYIYLYAPWIGTVVVSNAPFAGATEQAAAFDGHTLTVAVGDHNFQVYSDSLLLGKKPEPGYVLVDRDFKLPSRVPVMGYGSTLRAPYTWPGAKEISPSKGAVEAPPVPVNLRPKMLLPPCPAGQMRAAAAEALPGEPDRAQPCVPIVPGKSVSGVASPTPR